MYDTDRPNWETLPDKYFVNFCISENLFRNFAANVFGSLVENIFEYTIN